MKANGKFRADEKAVSPVIGVILMVAITVILAAIIAAFVFGMAPPAMAPQASIRGVVVQDADGDNYIKLEHQGGDTLTIDDANIRVVVEGTEVETYPDPGAQLRAGEAMYIACDAIDSYILTNTTTAIATKALIDLPTSAQTVNIKIVDVASQQYIADITVRG